jgi:hypothetical protein
MEVTKMPNVNITVYLSDEEYLAYVPAKQEINENARTLVKSEVKGRMTPATKTQKKAPNGGATDGGAHDED